MHNWRSTTSSWVSRNTLSLSLCFLFLAVHQDIDLFCPLYMFPWLEKWWARRRRRVTLWMYAPGITKSMASALWRSASSVWNSSRPPGVETLKRTSEFSPTCNYQLVLLSTVPRVWYFQGPCSWKQFLIRDKTTVTWLLVPVFWPLTWHESFYSVVLRCLFKNITMFLVIKYVVVLMEWSIIVLIPSVCTEMQLVRCD